ncbi:hypothetical protein MHU86_2693 [Fragilaria crotonensis]|nr:hypothetical protein MHU86_2693 [Fragilaria crotonensis]
MSHSPPNSDATEYFPDDPMSAYQRFGPPDLDNWLPDSGATSHYTPVFSDLHDVEPCHVPVSLADGTTKISTFKAQLTVSSQPQKERKLSLVLLMFITLKVLVTVCFP